MKTGEVVEIFKNLDTDDYTFTAKLIAIDTVLDMETHNGITKECLLKALRWMYDFDYEYTITKMLWRNRDGEINENIRRRNSRSSG